MCRVEHLAWYALFQSARRKFGNPLSAGHAFALISCMATIPALRPNTSAVINPLPEA
jgi:hypothetical protein